jgi:hypothetical protein
VTDEPRLIRTYTYDKVTFTLHDTSGLFVEITGKSKVEVYITHKLQFRKDTGMYRVLDSAWALREQDDDGFSSEHPPILLWSYVPGQATEPVKEFLKSGLRLTSANSGKRSRTMEYTKPS